VSDPRRADVCAVAIAEAFRGDGERLCNPIGNLPLIGGRLAAATFEPHLALTDGFYSLLDNVPPVGLDRRSERLGADFPQTGMLHRAEHAVVEGGDDRVPGHMTMIDEHGPAVKHPGDRR